MRISDWSSDVCSSDLAQAAAATGRIALSHKWAELLEAKGLTAAQILVTLDDLEHRRRYLNASATLERLLGLGVVPVVNENDSVATAEIRFGDRSEEHTTELPSLMRIANAVFCLKKKKQNH